MHDVFITKTSSFLPNKAISNNEMEDYLGLIAGKVSKSKNIILRNNKIEQRYYAIDKEGNSTHTNGEMVALAVKDIFSDNPDKIKEVDLLCCGTSSPDQMMPSHGMMVHGCLPELNAIEVLTPSGNCCAGMQALSYAFQSLKLGLKQKAITTGSERIAKSLRAESYEEEVEKLNELDLNPIIGFEKDFIRWMLSDGAGAFLLETEPSKNSTSLKIEWVENISFANQEDVCMYQGGYKDEQGKFIGLKDVPPKEIMDRSILSIKQDTKILGDRIVPLGVGFIMEKLEGKKFKFEEIDYFLPHLSSYFFEDKIYNEFLKYGKEIPKEKWFTNLKYKGNVGAGSIYIMVDELLKSGKLQKDQKILLMIPESARFSYSVVLLTVC